MSAPMELDRVVRSESLAELGTRSAHRYQLARPFPHLVIDDFFDDALFDQMCREFSQIAPEAWTNYVHVNERKRGNTKIETWGENLALAASVLFSPQFTQRLEGLTGYQGLIGDSEFDGGGLHRSTTGGHLNVHADFTAHHRHPRWRRRVNVLLYLNQRWDDEWGGHLELWKRDMSQCEARIAPRGNRIVVFSTDESSFHGHPSPLQCPPDVARQSLAVYFFTEEDQEFVRATSYRARPGDGLRRVPIYVDSLLLKGYDRVKRRLRLDDSIASRWLGRRQR